MSPAVFALLAVSAASGLSGGLAPASTAAILDGASVCMGATVDRVELDKKLVGWTPAFAAKAAPAARAPAKGAKGAKGRKAPVKPVSSTAGRIFSRDGVMLVVKSGIDGGCVVDAKADTAFDKKAFYGSLGQQLGVPVASDDPDKAPLVALANGESVKVVVTGDRLVKLVFGRQSNK